MIVALRCCYRAAAAATVRGRRYADDKTEMFQRRLRAETVGRRFQLSDDALRDVMLRISYVPRTVERAGPSPPPPPSDCPCAALLRDCGCAAARAVVGLVVDDRCACCYAAGRRAAVVDAEWAAFGERGELDRYRNRYDRSLDARSRNPGRRIFEKLTSGAYAAELVRGMVTDMAAAGALPGPVRSAGHAAAERRLRAEHLRLAERDERGAHHGARLALTGTLPGARRPTDFDCELFRYACECATKRSAHLVAAGLAGLLLRLAAAARPPATIVVAVGGALFDEHPGYAATVSRKTAELTGGRVPFAMRTTGRGTATGPPDVVSFLAPVLTEDDSRF